ncbi:hypothetical protein [Agrobacterium sp. NPDC090273]|uniref:hypothetical protein n=1 Tax=Agrobacterium sp. NPDC090273 TaxID=3363919 RepID=UPI00383B20C1
MQIRQRIMDNHGIYYRDTLHDGSFERPEATTHDELDQRLLDEVDGDSNLTSFTGFLTAEVFDDEDYVRTGATLQMLFSTRKELAAILYDNPSLTGAFIEWVVCRSPEEALEQWKKKVRLPQLRETSFDPMITMETLV